MGHIETAPSAEGASLLYLNCLRYRIQLKLSILGPVDSLPIYVLVFTPEQ